MSGDIYQALWKATVETIYMTGVAALFVLVVGLPLGVLLVALDKGGFWEQRWLQSILAGIVNIGRSAPFVILMVAIVPLTRLLIGTTIGTTAAIVPLVIAAIPFMARVVEQSLREVDPGRIEAAQAMGASAWQIIGKVLIPESLPSLIRGLALMVISVLGYSAMAGAIGGGGLGDLAVKYGYMRFRTDVMIGCLIILVVLVQFVQLIGDLWASRLTHK